MKIIESRNKREGRYAGRLRRQYDHPGGTRHHRDGVPLPHGLAEDMMGTLYARCRSCENVYKYLGEPRQFTQDMSYCNGSDRCIP